MLRELARGGVGAVYEAIDESSGRRVALKRLLDGAQDKSRLALLFEAEFDTLSRLRHPHIVEVFDYGIDKHGPYFTMQLLDGRDLGELAPLPYREACRYLRDVASSVALLHTRRRLHRDLSPRNVRVTSDGRCRLLDFGTMANFGVPDDIVGTPPLVPPEALRGTALDHRADLYSLGALAYRVLSGRYPYRARQLEDLPELWRTPLTRLRELVPELPVELDELVMSMLSLDPAFRPSTTYEVIDRLTAIGELPPDAEQKRTAQGYLVGSRLIGRGRQLESIQRRIARAHRERGGVVIIEGNPGVGKSRLLDEAALQAQLSGALTVRVDARAHPGHYGVANAMAKAILEAAPRDARDAAQPYLTSLGQALDAFYLALPQVRAERANAGQLLAPTRSQLRGAVLNWLFDLAEDRTLVLLIDDLPRVDEGSAALLNSLAQAVPQHRILLVATRRLVDKVPASAGVDAMVARARRLRLHRLRSEDTLALLSSLFGAVPNVELLGAWIHEVTTGTPMQIMELARHLVRENIVRFVDGMWVLPPHVPHDRLQRNLAATLSARAAALPPPERALAEALSVRRGNLALPLCMRLSDDKDTRALFRNLDELVAKGVLLSGKNGFHFEQDALRQVLLRQLPAKRAQRLHLRLGEALLQHATHPEDLLEAGFNLILGGAEMRGADLVASVAPKLPFRGTRTTAALPALDAALEVYEKWGRGVRDCLRLRTVLAGSMDKRSTALYADSTLETLCGYAGGDHAQVFSSVLPGRAGFLVGHAAAYMQRKLTPKPQRGPHPRSAMYAFYRVAFGALSVRSSAFDLAGTQRLAEQTARLANAGPLPGLIADTFHIQVLALRGDVEPARQGAHAALARLKRESAQLSKLDPAAVSGVLASLYIGLGMLEAHYGLRSGHALNVIDELAGLAERAHLEEPVSGSPLSGAVAELELVLAADQLRFALHLARAERYLAEAHSEARRNATLTGMHHQFEIWRNAIDCHMSMRAMDVAGLRRTVETFTHYVAEHPDLVPWLEIARAHLALSLGKPQEALAGYDKWSAQIQPGNAFAWDTLSVGHAEALIAAGEAPRACEWLRRLLAHPVLQSADQVAARANLSALYALAQAEKHWLEAASERIHTLERELADADHPLVLGFVHEVAARVAQRRRDEASAQKHLGEMKRWYTSTRNPALMARGQRVQDSFSESRATSCSPISDKDRSIVTRVTTRRDST